MDDLIAFLRAPECNQDGCEQGGRLTRGMCSKHYRYWLDHTPPEDRPVAPRFQREFWDFVVKTHDRGCWTWREPRDKKGYGRWGKVPAHRHSWMLAHGEIPDDLWVLHHCDNPPCVNPAHLYLGTVVENVQDMVARGRNYVPPLKDRCDKGHELVGENLRVVGRERRRFCRACDNERSARWQRENRAARGLRKTRVTEDEKTKIVELRVTGLSHRKIASQIGRSLMSVQSVLKAAGL